LLVTLLTFYPPRIGPFCISIFRNHKLSQAPALISLAPAFRPVDTATIDGEPFQW